MTFDYKVGVRIIKAEKVLMPKVKINLFEFSKLFKVSFVLGNSSRFEKSIDIIYFITLNNHNEYYTENCTIAEIT